MRIQNKTQIFHLLHRAKNTLLNEEQNRNDPDRFSPSKDETTFDLQKNKISVNRHNVTEYSIAPSRHFFNNGCNNFVKKSRERFNRGNPKKAEHDTDNIAYSEKILGTFGAIGSCQHDDNRCSGLALP